MIYIPRPDGRKGGGIAILFKKSLTVKVIDFSKTKSCQFEYLVCSVCISKFTLRIIVLYRPNPTSTNNLSVSRFWGQFERFLSKHALCSNEIILTGDLNFHLDNISCNNTLIFNSMLDEFGLSQKIKESTHVAGHTLDVLIVRVESEILKSIKVEDPKLCNENGKLIEDHFALHWSIDVIRPRLAAREIRYRELKKIDYSQLVDELLKTDFYHLCPDDNRSPAELAALYDETLSMLLDKFAPVKSKTIIQRGNTPWFTQEISQSKRLRRQAERKFKSSKSAHDHALLRRQCGDTQRVLRKVKREFYSSQILSANRDQKAIFQLTNSWMGSNKNVLPSGECHKTLANDISHFFAEKARNIHKNLTDTVNPLNPYIPVRSDLDPIPPQQLHSFKPSNADEIKKIVGELAAKHCELDPAPTSVVKNLIEHLAPGMSIFINKSFSSGCVPPLLKRALVRPALKDSALDPENIANYRPVSNLSFLSKVMEKVVNSRLDDHLEGNLLLSDSQSAYRKCHSTETLLIKVQNDILESLDKGHATILVMLDVSAAFDVVDHQRLLDRHRQLFGINGTALEWLESYLSGRSQCVVIGNEKSSSVNIEFGFPQGSVLGGKKFIMYATPLGTLIFHHKVDHKCYADDTQKYISFCLKDPDAAKSAIVQLQNSLGEVQLWMSANMLKMNNDKTEVIVFAPTRHLENLADLNVIVDTIPVEPSQQVDNLGVIFDATLSMKQQINSVTSTCYYHIRRISKIRKYLTEDATKSLINAYVVSRLDYCNGLYSELPSYLLKKLQRVQNRAARLVKKLPWRSRITRHLKDLHWLPVTERIKFKLLLITYKSLNNLSPKYLTDLFSYYSPPRILRSSSRKLLVVKRTKTKYGTRALTNCGPKLWNQLPLHIRNADSLVTFKNRLKTHLFSNYYNAT